MYFEYRSSITSQIIWKKDTLTLKKETSQSFRKKDKEARVMVDTFSTLYLTGNNMYIDLLDFMKTQFEIFVLYIQTYLYDKIAFTCDKF